MARTLVILGVLLIVLGAIPLGYEGVTYISREKVAEVGPVQVTADRQRTIWFSPVVGVIFLAAGVGLVTLGVINRPGG